MSDNVSEEFEEVEHELDELAHERSGKKSDDNNTSKDDDDITVSLAEKGKSSMKKATKHEKQWWEFFVSVIPESKRSR